jgi:hypothetical protein
MVLMNKKVIALLAILDILELLDYWTTMIGLKLGGTEIGLAYRTLPNWTYTLLGKLLSLFIINIYTMILFTKFNDRLQGKTRRVVYLVLVFLVIYFLCTVISNTLGIAKAL